jgi:hypothetical protein
MTPKGKKSGTWYPDESRSPLRMDEVDPLRTLSSRDFISAAPGRRTCVWGPSAMSNFDVGFVIYPGITQLDFTGPFEVLSRLSTPPSASIPSRFPQSRTHVVAKTLQPVASDRGLSILPTCTFEGSPSLDLICIPGGAGTVEALADVETVDFIRRQGEHAQFVTSVCIGVSSRCSRIAEGASGRDALGLR